MGLTGGLRGARPHRMNRMTAISPGAEAADPAALDRLAATLMADEALLGFCHALAAEGLIALSGAKEGEVGHALLDGEPAAAEAVLREWMEVFPERFYLEVQRTNRVNDEEHLHAAVALADKLETLVGLFGIPGASAGATKFCRNCNQFIKLGHFYYFRCLEKP